MDVKRILAVYGLSAKNISRPPHAALTHVYLIDGKYVLRGRPCSKEALHKFREEQRLMARVHAHIPYEMPSLLKTKAKQDFVIRKKTVWTVYPLLPGKILCPWQTAFYLPEDKQRKIVNVALEIVRRTRFFRRPDCAFINEVKNTLKRMRTGLSPHTVNRVKTALQTSRAYTNSLKNGCFVHGDLHTGNALVDGRGRITALLDTDWCRIGTRYEDISYYTMMMLRDFNTNPRKYLTKKLIRKKQRWFGGPNTVFDAFIILYCVFDMDVFMHSQLPGKYYRFQKQFMERVCELL